MLKRFREHGLDLQLKKHGIHELIVVGLIAHTCVEATVRYAAELGYQVTVVKDATSSYSEDHMHITDSVGGGLGTEIAIDQRQQAGLPPACPGVSVIATGQVAVSVNANRKFRTPGGASSWGAFVT